MIEAASSPAIEVLETGLQLTVQDVGRRGYEHLGVARAGAADPRSLVLANGIVGNDPGAAALEATLLGPRLRALREIVIAIAGADLAAVLQPGDRPLDRDRPHVLRAGDELAFEEAGDPDRGCRAYIAFAGGIDVPVVLGSRSTSLVGAFGGLDGRALQAGDVLAAFAPPEATTRGPTGPSPEDTGLLPQEAIRVLPGPAAAEPGGEGRLRALLDRAWTIALASDRRGLRLESDRGPIDVPADAGDRPSHGVVPGTIQLTPSGQPLVLMPDAGVTGGYPVIAVVTAADLWRLGQLVPGAAVRFRTPT
jgi:5-oxoprolinase (ATP-hydrolysing) subunit C